MKNFYKFAKSKAGMTYVELLVALSLLMFIIVAFTPMLLSSYSTLYDAGERTQSLYGAKAELEKGLSTRLSSNIAQANIDFNNLINNIGIKGRRVASTLKENFETVFHGAKASIDVISGNIIYDDSLEHEILIQCTNLSFDSVVGTNDKGTVASWGSTPPAEKNPANQEMLIIAYKPNKSAGENKNTDDERVYTTDNLVPITDVSFNSTTGKIKLKISGFDFTNSPIKLKVLYYDEKCVKRDVSTYLYVKPATILIGGSTGTYDYYTSPGVKKTLDNETGNESESLELYGRTMTKSNSSLVNSTGTPTDLSAEILNVSWIDTDTTSGIDPYYVLTGTKGTIYRMYNFSTSSGDLYSKIVPTLFEGRDKLFKLPDGTKIYSNLWSGDKTDQFGYSTWYKSMGYSGSSVFYDNTSCWYTQEGVSGVTADAYDELAVQAKFAYNYNGWRTNYEYSQQNGRRISYVLTESQTPLRVTANMKDKDSFKGYNKYWESSTKYLSNGAFEDHEYKINEGTWLKPKYVYPMIVFHVYGNVASDKNLAYLNIKSFNNLGTDYLYNETKYSDPGSKINAKKMINRETHLNTPGATASVNITSAVYDEGMGGMFYTGSVDSYVYINQTDNTSTSSNYSKAVEVGAAASKIDNSDGTFTGYYLAGTEAGTTVKKISESGGKWGTCKTALQAVSKESTTEKSASQLVSFYVDRTTSVADAFLKDVNVTFGFSSNREKVFQNITVDNNGKEQYKSYEKYYFLSHYGITAATYDNSPTTQAHYYSLDSSGTGYNETLKNSYNNDYYNVWFPGEFYNITHTVSLDGVTVGVGYAVSGSTFQWVNPSQTTNTSTALGSVYNDGVLAVKTLQHDSNGKVVDSDFTNKLYFKDNGTFDSSSLTSNEYKNTFGTYGTHSRRSVQFTAVGLTKFESGKTKNYYAVYGDNTGRVFMSLVAKGQTTGSESDSAITAVDYIRDLTFTGTASSNSSEMEEIKINNKPLSAYFKDIVSITAKGELIVISGTPVSGSVGYVAVGVRNDSNVWTWKLVKILNDSSFNINDGLINDGYYYACGNKGSQGFLIACDIQKIKEAENGTNLTTVMPAAALLDGVQFNSLAGHSTQG